MSRSVHLPRQVLAVKAGAVILGIIILVVAAVLGWISISDDGELNDLENAMDDFLRDLSTYERMNAYQEPLVNHFDVVKLKVLSGDQIRDDLNPEHDFIIEIIDVSQYSNTYSFTQENGAAFKVETSSDHANTLVWTRVATLVVGQENHAAIIKVTMMS